MPETCRDIYDNKSQTLHQISHHKKMTASLQIGLLQNFLAWKSCNNSKLKIRGTTHKQYLTL
jgi:hypothetical protein